MNPLLERFHGEKRSFSRLKRLCESKVVRWRYWEWPDWHWEPDYFMGEGTIKPERAPKSKATYHYGYDREDRVVVIHDLLSESQDSRTGWNF